MKKSVMAVLILQACLLAACGTAPVAGVPVGKLTQTEDLKAREMMDSVRSINDRSPASFDYSFTVEGAMKTKKFKSTGTAQFDGDQDRFSASFVDFIFKSPLTSIFQNADEVILYFPSDKKLFRENRNVMNLRNYSGVNIPFQVAFSLVAGKIPLLENYAVKEGYVSADGSSSYLILENSECYETISFSNGAPDRIKFLRKREREELEIYLRKRTVKDGCLLYQNVMILVKDMDVKIDITFSVMKVNGPVKVKTISDIKLPVDVQVMTM
jgi:hypothetical protein